MRVLVLRNCKVPPDQILQQGTTHDVDDSLVARHPELFRAAQVVEAERARAEARPTEAATERLDGHLRQREAMAKDSAAEQRARAALLTQQAQSLQQVASEAAKQAELPAAPPREQFSAFLELLGLSPADAAALIRKKQLRAETAQAAQQEGKPSTAPAAPTASKTENGLAQAPPEPAAKENGKESAGGASSDPAAPAAKESQTPTEEEKPKESAQLSDGDKTVESAKRVPPHRRAKE